MASPALRLLVSGRDDPGQALAVFLRSGRSPRVFALRERHKLVQAVQAAALARLGITLAGRCWGRALFALCLTAGGRTLAQRVGPSTSMDPHSGLA